MEQTFIAIKPDAVQRGLSGEIIKRFEQRGFKLVGLKLMQVPKALAEKHYEAHSSKPFFAGLVEFLCSSPIVAMVWQGNGVIDTARKMMGATNPLNAEPGTIRGDFSVDIGRNVIHGSDSPKTRCVKLICFLPKKNCVITGSVTTKVGCTKTSPN